MTHEPGSPFFQPEYGRLNEYEQMKKPDYERPPKEVTVERRSTDDLVERLHDLAAKSDDPAFIFTCGLIAGRLTAKNDA